MTDKFDVVLIEKPGEEGLNKDEMLFLFDLIEGEAYPMEVMATQVESSAMGLITAKAARKLNFEYSCLEHTIASILDDMSLETPAGIYEMQGLKVRILR